MHYFFEAIIVGIMLALSGAIVSKLVTHFYPQQTPEICKDWNKNHIMEITLFLLGFLFHVGSEIIGLNGWYCKYGSACSRHK